jgi:hypothetical protein
MSEHSQGSQGPMVGGGGRLPRRSLIRRGAVALALGLLLVAGKVGVSHGVIKVRTLSPPSHAVATGLLIGAAPSDSDLRQLASAFKVDGVVNLGAPSVAEQVTAASLHLGYLYLPLAPQTSPSWPELRELASFLRTYAAGDAAVYVHDDVGGGRAVVTAAMLLLLRGQAWPAASADLTRDELGSLCDCQLRAIGRLSSALHRTGSRDRSLAGDPYAAARLEPW